MFQLESMILPADDLSMEALLEFKSHSGFHLQSELFQWLLPPDDLSMEACCAIKYFPEVDSLQSEKVLVISLSLQSEKVLFISLSRN